MYSIVLMSALATGGDTASFGGRSGCLGSSCSGVVVSGCSGCTGYAVPAGCCGGYVAPSGCCGGRSLFPLFPNLRARLGGLFSRGCGGCTGYAVSSCYGASCVGSSCLGSTAYGPSYFGSTSYHAPTLGYNFAGMPTFSQGYSMGGCYGTGAVGPYYYGADFNNPPIIVVPPMTPPVVPLSQQEDRDHLVSQATPTGAVPARLTVELPADATLFVDGEKVIGTGTVRNFHTPNLPAGTFFYDLKAEVKVDGELVTETVRVLVKAGDAKTESFGKLFAAVKAAKNPAFVSK